MMPACKVAHSETSGLFTPVQMIAVVSRRFVVMLKSVPRFPTGATMSRIASLHTIKNRHNKPNNGPLISVTCK